MIGLFAMNYHVHPESVLDMTMANLTMYNSIMPNYDDSSDNDNIVITATNDNIDEVDRLLGLK